MSTNICLSLGSKVERFKRDFSGDYGLFLSITYMKGIDVVN